MTDMQKKKENIAQAKKWPQYIAALTASIPMLCSGTCMSWTSVALDYLQTATNDTVAITNLDASWIASMMPLGALIGSLPAGYLADKIGRKLSILVLSSAIFIGWIIIILSDRNVTLLYIARFIYGFGVGGTSVVIPIYNEEISEVRIRGAMGCYTDFMISTGFMWTYVFGSFLSYFWLNIVCVIPTVIFYLTFTWMPESPVYLLFKSREMDAIQALGFFRGVKYLHGYDLGPELSEMKGYLKEGESDSKEGINIYMKLEYIKQCLFISKNISTTAKSMRIIFTLIILIHLTGVEGLISYTYEIDKRGRSSISLGTSNFIIGIVQFITSLVSVFTIDKFGRRFCLLSSGAGMTLAMGMLVVHSMLLNVEGYIEQFGWMPCFLEVVFISSDSAGSSSVPWLLAAELVPTESKAWVLGICELLLWTFELIVIQIFNFLLNNVMDAVTYSIFFTLCILNLVHIALCIPETKNKSRAEIQNKLLELISKKHFTHT